MSLPDTFGCPVVLQGDEPTLVEAARSVVSPRTTFPHTSKINDRPG